MTKTTLENGMTLTVSSNGENYKPAFRTSVRIDDANGDYLIIESCSGSDKAIAKLIAKAEDKVAKIAAKAAAKSAKIAERHIAENREECQICEGSWAMVAERVSLHGYTRPGCGYTIGECMGAKELPYSQSCEVLKAYRIAVANFRAKAEAELARIESATVLTRIEEDSDARHAAWLAGNRRDKSMKKVTYTQDHFRFTDVQSALAASEKTNIRFATADLVRVDARIANWIAPATAGAK